MKADLHIHTTYSDGILTVQEVLNLALKEGLTHISITDHDTLAGTLEALNTKTSLTIIPGIELSTYHNNESIHILGYFKPNANFSKLQAFLEQQQTKRYVRAQEIFLRLEKLGIKLDFAKISSISSITRGTIADLVIDSGYFYTKQEIFDKFLGDHAPAYVPSTKFPTSEGIELLKSVNAIPVLAHPVNIKRTPISEFIKMGILGIEAIYPINSLSNTQKFLEIAEENNLLVTAGSDFHQFNDYKHGNLGQTVLTKRRLEKLLQALNEG